MLSLIHLNRNIRTIRRSRQIIRVLIKYGFGHVLEMMNLAQVVARGRKLFRRPESQLAQLAPAERMRLALEELGPTFIKLGQLLSTRPDIIPRQFVQEFAKLQDMVPSSPPEEIRQQINLELGKDVGELFKSFDPEPLAAASIAQVHRATLRSGEKVVVKVRRPGVAEVVETDIDVMTGLATLAQRHIPGSEFYEPVGVVREFARTIRREMDFTREGHTLEKVAANFRNDPSLYVPRVFWEQTAKGVLTMEFIDGIKVSDLAALDAAGLDRPLIAERGANVFLKMVLVHGFFHGDPHPGNVFILPGNVICLLDYGMVGHLDIQLRDYLTDILLAIVRRDMDEVISILLYSGEVAEAPDIRALKHDLSEFIDSYYEIPLQEIEVGRMLMEFLEIITTYQIRFRTDLMLLAKALVSVEGMGRELNPRFDMIEHLRPFMERASRERLAPTNLLKGLASHAGAYVKLARNLPRDLKEIINRINRNKFKIDLEHRGLDRFINELDRSINRLSSSLIIAALIIGTSIVIQTDKGPKLLGFPVFAFLGFTIAGLIGLWWVIAIIRSGRL